MITCAHGANRGRKTLSDKQSGTAQRTKPEELHAAIVACLDDAKAEEVVTIDLEGKSSIGDYMVVASGRSQRHVGAIADQIQRQLKDMGHGRVRVEGMPACDWVLIDTGDVVAHIFRPEVREFYNLEKMWQGDRPSDSQPNVPAEVA